MSTSSTASSQYTRLLLMAINLNRSRNSLWGVMQFRSCSLNHQCICHRSRRERRKTWPKEKVKTFFSCLKNIGPKTSKPSSSQFLVFPNCMEINLRRKFNLLLCKGSGEFVEEGKRLTIDEFSVLD